MLGRLTGLLRSRRRHGRWGEPIGLLTHHLDHDEAAWRFLDDLLLFAPLRDAALWPEASVLFSRGARAAEAAPAFRKEAVS